MIYFKITDDKVCWVTIHDRVLKKFKSPPKGINQTLLRVARSNPKMKIGTFINLYLGSVRPLTRITQTLVDVGGITPEILCLVDPKEWVVMIDGFGRKSADSLQKAIDEYSDID